MGNDKNSSQFRSTNDAVHFGHWRNAYGRQERSPSRVFNANSWPIQPGGLPRLRLGGPMHVLDHIRTSDQWNVRIALYHRGHLSLYPGTTVHLAPIFRLNGNAQTNGHGTTGSFPEVIGTTIQRAAWGSVYRLSISMYDT